MTTQEVANELVKLCREGKWEECIQKLYSPEIKSDLANLIKRVDKTIAQHIHKAIEDGQLSEELDVDMLATHLQASLHSIAIRSRAGASKQSLRKYATFAVQQLPCRSSRLVSRVFLRYSGFREAHKRCSK